MEYCKISVEDSRVSISQAEKGRSLYWSIPIENTIVLMLGPGTSVTQHAMRLLAEENVMVLFTAGGGTPVLMGTLNEYRPTQYMQHWATHWSDEQWRLKTAIEWQKRRIAWVRKHHSDNDDIVQHSHQFEAELYNVQSTTQLLGYEGQFVKQLYANIMSDAFTRNPNQTDVENTLITIGNYICYGLAASVLWTMGISFAMPLIHGTTRRGGLVFDLADTIKSHVLLAYQICLLEDDLEERHYRNVLLERLDKDKALTFLFTMVKDAST